MPAPREHDRLPFERLKQRPLALGGVFLLGLIAVGLLLPVGEALTAALEFVRDLGGWGPPLWALIYIVAAVSGLPSAPIGMGAGALFGLVRGFPVASLGGVLGALAAFGFARRLARGWVEPRLAGHPRLAALDAAVAREGFKIVLLARLSPVLPYNLLNYGFGLTRVPFRDYLLGSWLGMIPGCLFYVYLGTAARDLADIAAGRVEAGTGGQILLGAGLIATIAVLVVLTRGARRALEEALQRP